MEFTDLVKTHLNILSEIEARDAVFRRSFGEKERREKAPWIMLGRKEFREEEKQIYQDLHDEQISDPEAVAKITLLMEMYYESKY